MPALLMRPCLPALLIGLASTACDHLPCEFSAVLPDLAGPGATDCGAVALGADATAVDACVVDAFVARRPFFAVYALQGTDSQVSSALASDGRVVWTLMSDSDVGGGAGLGASIDRRDCPSPTVAPGEAGHDVVTCAFSDCVCHTRLCGPVALGGNDCCG